jgi:hypothetical protein
MKLTFLGASSLLADGHNSNILIDCDGKTLLFDCGITLKQSLKDANRNISEIDAIYISHLHSDHCGSLEWIGYYSYFILNKKMQLFIHESLYPQLKSMFNPGMDRTEDKEMSLSNYFDVKVVKNRSGVSFSFASHNFKLKERLHIESPIGNIYSYGLTIDTLKTAGSEAAVVFISSDSKEVHVEGAQIMFHDCDFNNYHGVHADYNLLKKLPDNIKSKMWLYHHHNKWDDMPNVKADGFAGIVKQGQIFNI